MEEVFETLADHPSLGILRLDYDYPAAPGDIDCPDSYGYPVVFRVVPGLTFQMAQSGKLTDQVAEAFDDAILWLANEQKVSAITGDCGFMMWFQDRARFLTTTPVFLSALIQLPMIASALCKDEEKIIVMTANVRSLLPMQDLIERVAGVSKEKMHFVYVGCEDIQHFGYEVENGLQVDVAKAEPGIIDRAKAAQLMYPTARGFLMECTELPPYSDAVRAATGLPVFDAITNCDFVLQAFLDNERFGRGAWYKKWDGRQKDYTFALHLTEAQRRQLVSKPVGERAMNMIIEHLENASLLNELENMGYEIRAEQVAHAIAETIESNEIQEHMRRMEAKMEAKSSRFKHIRGYFRRLLRSPHHK